MCQLCSLANLVNRGSPLGAQPQSLSSWGALQTSGPLRSNYPADSTQPFPLPKEPIPHDCYTRPLSN
ncbi:hypothetical protein XM38_023570 [Halomicronema hongdechloris C2206]|uniref:Uncharacterized protein n=1 Tax=Halomicronema hongdechloris C2206 TaxID=1641165 RepID=A0A1Z3HMA2_9CYAN|nr:hypothetical protein XM38_023570 [Halomicronema hongdechloris C2206]